MSAINNFKSFNDYQSREDWFNECVTQNFILKGDAYKHSHFLQLPPKTTNMYSYIESRGGKYKKTVFFGLQSFIMRYLMRPITTRQIDYAERKVRNAGLPFNREGWDYIVSEYGGMLPLTIKAPKEGLVIEGKNVLVSIETSDPKLAWLVGFTETAILRSIWYSVSVATGSWETKQVIKTYLERTSDDPAGALPFKLHDFGARAASSSESAGLGGLAHLINFKGTDTIEALPYAEFFYNEDLAGFSIPAAEHSTITSWGKGREASAYENMLVQFAFPGSLVAVVSDSYDIWNAVDHIWGEQLRQQVIDSGATVVIRPDSGDPLVVPVQVIEKLDAKFGHTINSKGFKVLNVVRVIQGDGVDRNTIEMILGKLAVLGYSTDNIAFGQGGTLLQAGIDRDMLKFAMKTSAAEVDGEWIDVFKEPITDPGKKSKRGKLALVWSNNEYVTRPSGSDGDILETVYHNGHLFRIQDFVEVRELSEGRLTTWEGAIKAA